MPKYRVNVSRIAYGNLDFIVDAKNPTQAMRQAEAEAGNHVFSEHTSEYQAQGATRIEEPKLPKYPCFYGTETAAQCTPLRAADCAQSHVCGKKPKGASHVPTSTHPVRKSKNRR